MAWRPMVPRGQGVLAWARPEATVALRQPRQRDGLDRGRRGHRTLKPQPLPSIL